MPSIHKDYSLRAWFLIRPALFWLSDQHVGARSFLLVDREADLRRRTTPPPPTDLTLGSPTIKTCAFSVPNTCCKKPHSIVWWEQTIVCRQHTIVWPEQTIVWWQQTNKRRRIGTQLSFVFCSYTMNSYAYSQR